MPSQVLVIDQGTTSTRAMVFGPDMAPLAVAQQEFPQLYPRAGWVEHDPEAIWRSTLETLRRALAKAPKGDIAALGLTNQRETTLVWDRRSGEPVYNAIVWQDRRTAEACERLKADGAEAFVRERTGLLLDPYFSATKIAWILDNVADARARAERGELAFGTVDCYLIWRLTGGGVHATDATNASRTLLYDIHAGAWDDELLRLFGIPRSMLPKVQDTAGEFGALTPDIIGVSAPILAVAGDQQAALVGQACFAPGALKATFGTGGFLLLNTGVKAVASSQRLLTTIAYQWRGERAYALEGSIFSAGATVQWLRDGLGIIGAAHECDALAAAADPYQDVYLVPAFAGLGAPHWRADARGTVVGLTRGSTRKEIARAALESVGYQTRDLVQAMRADAGPLGEDAVIRVDGGMAASDWTMQFLADMLDAPVDRPTVTETTSLGVGYLAGWQAGLYPDPEGFAANWRLEWRFAPKMEAATRERRYSGWRDAVARALAPSGG
jgi:glycerol kinase